MAKKRRQLALCLGHTLYIIEFQWHYLNECTLAETFQSQQKVDGSIHLLNIYLFSYLSTWITCEVVLAHPFVSFLSRKAPLSSQIVNNTFFLLTFPPSVKAAHQCEITALGNKTNTSLLFWAQWYRKEYINTAWTSFANNVKFSQIWFPLVSCFNNGNWIHLNHSSNKAKMQACLRIMHKNMSRIEQMSQRLHPILCSACFALKWLKWVYDIFNTHVKQVKLLPEFWQLWNFERHYWYT